MMMIERGAEPLGRSPVKVETLQLLRLGTAHPENSGEEDHSMPVLKRLTAVAILVAVTMFLLTVSKGTSAHGEILFVGQHIH
jgi:hypothetical protein